MTTTTTQPDTRFVAYEYLTVPVRDTQESLYRDAYRSFGWQTESVTRTGRDGVALHLKRDRDIPNKASLAAQQRQFEKSAATVDRLEAAKTTKGTAVAFSVGLLGSAALAGAVFLLLGGHLVWMVVLGVIGFIGWALPYFLYRHYTAQQSELADEQIDREYDRMAEVCRRATDLAA